MKKTTMAFAAMLVTVMMVAGSPARATCPFSLPIFQGGTLGTYPATYITGAVGPLDGAFFAQGQGVVATGAGNDSGWIVEDFVATGSEGAYLLSDWGNAGVDGCPNAASSQSEALDAATVAFLEDLEGNYVVLGVHHVSEPVLIADFDRIGENQPVAPPAISPVIEVTSVDATTVLANVRPAYAGVHCYDDGTGICQDPETLWTAAELVEVPNGSAVPDCGPLGCSGVTLARDGTYCWNRPVYVAGSVTQDSGVCSIVPLPCNSDDYCDGFQLGVCLLPPPDVEDYGVLSGGCTTVEVPPGTFYPRNLVAYKEKGTIHVEFDVQEFEVNAYQVVSERGVISAPLFAQANDGSLQHYAIEVLPRNARGSHDLRLQTVFRNGTVNEVAFTVEKL